MKQETVVFVSDDHVPYQDDATFLCRLNAIRLLKPDVVFLGGDHCDFYQVSKFNQTPDRLAKLQDDIDGTHALIRGYREAAGPRCRMFFLEGNHEERLNKFVLRNAMALWSLRSLSLPSLLGLQPLKIAYVQPGYMEYRGVVFKHGNLASKKSGYTAYREMDDWWRSGVSGHTHRLSEVWKTAGQGDIVWTEAGCGCVPLDYVKGKPADWQAGFVYGYLTDTTWTPFPVKITKGRAIVNGEEVSA
uniref:Calcineurin-like phosphoesterase domain-containing protein n=1 Tax=Eiseniibacteriota bacterium TaxID=2212470 RepID=A0A832MKR8_UNCEI